MHKTLIDEYNTIKYNKHKERGGYCVVQYITHFKQILINVFCLYPINRALYHMD